MGDTIVRKLTETVPDGDGVLFTIMQMEATRSFSQLVSSSGWWILYSNCYLTPPSMSALKIGRILMKLNETWHLPSIYCCQTSSLFITMWTSSLFAAAYKPQFDQVGNSTYLSTTVDRIGFPTEGDFANAIAWLSTEHFSIFLSF